MKIFSNSPNAMSSESSEKKEEKVEEHKKGRGGPRRYQTPSPHLLRMRRQAANARERRRMNNLNEAYDQVKYSLFTVT